LKRTFYIAFGLLAVPVIVFYIFNAGKQQFDRLPYIGERIPPDGASVKDTIYYTVPGFSLVSQTGETITQKNFDNSIYVANFFFATCKDVCPNMNAKLADVYERYKEFAEVKFISHTVDPENDSVPVLAAYAKRFKADPKIWYFVTGSKDAIFRLGQGYLLPTSMEDSTIDHSQNLILVDKEKHIRGIYDGLDEQDVKRLKDEIKVLLYEYHQPQ
jgi:protein SCO1/2